MKLSDYRPGDRVWWRILPSAPWSEGRIDCVEENYLDFDAFGYDWNDCSIYKTGRKICRVRVEGVWFYERNARDLRPAGDWRPGDACELRCGEGWVRGEVLSVEQGQRYDVRATSGGRWIDVLRRADELRLPRPVINKETTMSEEEKNAGLGRYVVDRSVEFFDDGKWYPGVVTQVRRCETTGATKCTTHDVSVRVGEAVRRLNDSDAARLRFPGEWHVGERVQVARQYPAGWVDAVILSGPTHGRAWCVRSGDHSWHCSADHIRLPVLAEDEVKKLREELAAARSALSTEAARYDEAARSRDNWKSIYDKLSCSVGVLRGELGAQSCEDCHEAALRVVRERNEAREQVRDCSERFAQLRGILGCTDGDVVEAARRVAASVKTLAETGVKMLDRVTELERRASALESDDVRRERDQLLLSRDTERVQRHDAQRLLDALKSKAAVMSWQILDYRPMTPGEVRAAKDGTEAEFRQLCEDVNRWLVTRACNAVGEWWVPLLKSLLPGVLERVVHQFCCCGWVASVSRYAGDDAGMRLVLRARTAVDSSPWDDARTPDDVK